MPKLGSASIIGSKQPAHAGRRAMPPVAQLVRRWPRNRSVSSASRPSVLTTRAPSKLSCAISLTSARSCWARGMPRAHDRRW